MTAAAPARGERSSLEADYRELKARVRELGLDRPQPRYYTVKFVTTYALFAVPYALAFFLHGYAAAAGLGVFAAFASGQVVLGGHDVAHRQTARGRRANAWLALFTGFLAGLSRAWWTDKHNRHHANPNHDELDPDVNIAAVSFSRKQALEKRGLIRALNRYQAFLFFPVLTLEAANLRFTGLRWLLKNDCRLRRTEIAVLVGSTAGVVGVPVVALGPGPGLVFLAVSQALLGVYLGCIFAPNHKGMLMLGEGDQLDFFRRQVLTARNVRPGPVTDYVYGALNYQVEHHLFPALPRKNYGRARVLVKEFCAERGVPYHETGIVQSFREILASLHDSTAPLREH